MAQDWSAMRASNPDRDRATDVLKAAFAEGRLRPDEYEHRLGAVLGSQTYGELQRLVADLPAGPVFAPGQSTAPATPAVPNAQGPVSQVPPAPRTSGLATGALITGCAGFFTFSFAGPVAVVLGHLALQRIDRERESGIGLAITGLVFGYLQTCFLLLAIITMATF